jgi:signal transduction histidine kinase/ActR/RegA family two-component response regulator
VAVLPGHVYWKDLDCRFLGCNDLQASVVGLSDRSEIVGLSAYDVITDKQSETERVKQANAINQVDMEVMRTGQGVTVEEPLILADGSERIFLSQKIPLRDKNNAVIGLLGSSMDITEQKHAEEQARLAKEELEAVSKIKQMFLANMRHDIRTPFSGILSAAQMLADQEEDAGKKSVLQGISEASDLLLHYLNEILEFTEIDNGHIPVMLKAFDFHALLNDCYRMFMPSAEQKNIKLQKYYSEQLPKWIVSDRFRIQRILINLISNAIKFTETGSIQVGVHFIEKKAGRHGILKIFVKDTGVGIPKEKTNVIFEKFEILSPAYQSSKQGVGLGLVAVRDLVKSLDGNIYVKSKEGEGSTFVCVLPFEMPLMSDKQMDCLFDDGAVAYEEQVNNVSQPLAKQSEPLKSDAGAMNVLLVEDTLFAAEIAKKVLQKSGCIVEVVGTGEEAVTASKHHVYHLIIMDIGLPGIDGIEASKQIHSDGQNQQTPIIALTAHGSKELKRSCLNSGLQDMLEKPLTGDKAKEVIKAYSAVAKNGGT